MPSTTTTRRVWAIVLLVVAVPAYWMASDALVVWRVWNRAAASVNTAEAATADHNATRVAKIVVNRGLAASESEYLDSLVLFHLNSAGTAFWRQMHVFRGGDQIWLLGRKLLGIFESDQTRWRVVFANFAHLKKNGDVALGLGQGAGDLFGKPFEDLTDDEIAALLWIGRSPRLMSEKLRLGPYAP